MLKLQGKINYEITLDQNGYSVVFTDLQENEDVQDALAVVTYTRKIAEGTVKNMDDAKKHNRPYFNEHFKPIYNSASRTVRELKTIEEGIVDDLIVQHKIVLNDGKS